MKRAIVNPAQFVRYLVDRVSIKLTQFTMKNVSAGERSQRAELFLCLQTRGSKGRGRGRRLGKKLAGFRFAPDSLYLSQLAVCVSVRCVSVC